MNSWSSRRGTVEKNPTRNDEFAGSIPGLAQWVKDPHCCELWCRSQMQLGSCIAVAVAVVQASGYSSDLTPSLGTSICCRCSPKSYPVLKDVRLVGNVVL